MKHIYTICLILSSLFAYKYAVATSEQQQYAFFMPNNAFEGNTSVQDLEDMRPRYNKPSYKTVYEEDNDEYDVEEEEDDDDYNKADNKITDKKINASHPQKASTKPEITLPYVKKDIQITKPEKTKQIAKPIAKAQTLTKKTAQPKKAPELTETVQKKLQQYSLDITNQAPEDSDTPSVVTADSIKQLETKTISKMLEEIPYPNRTLPKFQQLYSIYGTELRVLYRRGELPKNKEQEDTLAKANSFRRFVVE